MCKPIEVTDALRNSAKILVDDMENCNYIVTSHTVCLDDTVFGMEDGKCKFAFVFQHYLYGIKKYQINQLGHKIQISNEI
jgi:hypothetical protein